MKNSCQSLNPKSHNQVRRKNVGDHFMRHSVVRRSLEIHLPPVGATTGRSRWGRGSPDPPQKKLDGSPNFLRSFLIGSGGGNRLRQTGYTFLKKILAKGSYNPDEETGPTNFKNVDAPLLPPLHLSAPMRSLSLGLGGWVGWSRGENPLD